MTQSDEMLLERVVQPIGAEEPARAKTSTERVRAFRERQGKLGNHASGMVLSARSQLAIAVIRQLLARSSKVGAIEVALVREARRLLPDAAEIDRLIELGKLPAELGSAWRSELVAVEADEVAEALAAASGATAKRSRKAPRTQATNAEVKVDAVGAVPHEEP